MKPGRPMISATLWLLLCTAGWLTGCVPAGTTTTSQTHRETIVGRIVALGGPDVTVGGRPARIGMQVNANHEVRTGPDSEVTIRFRNGAVLHLYENTDPIFDIIREPLCLLIRMFYGEAILDTNGACVEAETPESNAYIHSVIYIRVGPGLTIYQVYSGQLRLTARNVPGVRRTLSAGQAVEVLPDRILPVKRLTPRQMNELQWRLDRLSFPLPNWVGRPLTEVQGQLEKLGLRVDIRETRTRRGHPGTVIKQEPRAGKEVRRGDTVRLVVAEEGPPQGIRMPRCEGRHLQEVQAELRELGLRWKIETVRTRKFRPGTVMEQEPEAGREVRRGHTVRLVVAEEEGSSQGIRMPRCEGRHMQEVQAELKKLGLRWKIETVRTRKFRTGTVVRQEPGSGTEVRKGSTVRLVVEAAGSIQPPSSLKLY